MQDFTWKGLPTLQVSKICSGPTESKQRIAFILHTFTVDTLTTDDTPYIVVVAHPYAIN